MTENEVKNTVTQQQLAHLGEGAIAYMREMDVAELKGKFPGMPDMEPGTRLWALFAANGQPILLADARDAALAGAFQNDLEPVSLH
ncbi:DUF1150 family protein [Chelativorans sp. M5D2P16]|uniref:BQ00720 family protein n=1 Tax=Chelativorans sp. M5D2P16 TaxID=3095678 RepID=UPI002ACA0AD2|nr:DUF1150 family protein [Chelativorans sp. M5D2P16]MDZ5697204.1 DUF1150 family protein [Chelativorans sp. M5D2P16]